MVIDPFRLAQANQDIQNNKMRLAQMQQQQAWAQQDRPLQQQQARLALQKMQQDQQWAQEDRPTQQEAAKARLAQMQGQNETADAARKREVIAFGGNVAKQIRQAPEQAPAIYQQALQTAQQLGYDTSALPPEYSPQAQMVLDNLYQQSTAGEMDGLTAEQKQIREYRTMLENDDPLADEFALAAGFVKPKAEMSVNLEKRLGAATDEAMKAEARAVEYDTLATEIENTKNFGGGWGSSWREAYKDITGDQDAISSLRRSYNGVRAGEAVRNLPPGSASDADIALALSGFPPENASGDQISSFLRGLSKMQKMQADFNTFKAEYIAENGNEKGLLSEWKQRMKSSDKGQDEIISWEDL